MRTRVPRALAGQGCRQGSRTALDRARSLEENGAGPSGSGGGERGIFNHRSRGQARWAFRAWGSGGIARIRRGPLKREDGASVQMVTTEARFMLD